MWSLCLLPLIWIGSYACASSRSSYTCTGRTRAAKYRQPSCIWGWSVSHQPSRCVAGPLLAPWVPEDCVLLSISSLEVKFSLIICTNRHNMKKSCWCFTISVLVLQCSIRLSQIIFIPRFLTLLGPPWKIVYSGTRWQDGICYFVAPLKYFNTPKVLPH